MKTVLTEMQYLPPIAYFVQLLDYEALLLDRNENYQKQSYRNRCYILGANKVGELSVPVKKGNRKIAMGTVQIDYDQKWLPVHWKSICAAYGKAPFFEHYEAFFRQIFFKKQKFLFDLDRELLLLCLKLIGLNKEVSITESYIAVTNAEENGIYDKRAVIHPKKKYAEEICFEKYNQLFGKEFVENLSIIDLLFCEGPNSLQILRKSCTR